MSELTHAPAFVAYAVSAALLCLNLYGLWLFSGLTRNRTRTLINPEDTRLLSGRSIVERDPPEVARVLRAHANAMANILPFLILGFLYVLLRARSRSSWRVTVSTEPTRARPCSNRFGTSPVAGSTSPFEKPNGSNHSRPQKAPLSPQSASASSSVGATMTSRSTPTPSPSGRP